MSTEQKGFIVYKDLHAVIDELTDEQAGKLFRGMIRYFNDGVEPKFDGVLKFVFIPIRQQMDRDAEKYINKCEKMRSNAHKRWNDAKASNSIQTYANDANTNTNKDTNTKTITDTNTTTKTKGGGGLDCDEEFNIYKKLTPEQVDSIYDIYPESGGDLIMEVYHQVKKRKTEVKDAVRYILGYADKVGWDDKAEHFDYDY